MKEEVDRVSYTSRHSEIVEAGIGEIKDFFRKTDVAGRRSLLLSLDKFLDPYFGYDLSCFDEIINFLQEQLFDDQDLKIKGDILQLLRDYSKENLDYLASRINQLEPSLLANGVDALGCASNKQYLEVFLRYENHSNVSVAGAAKRALIYLSKK